MWFEWTMGGGDGGAVWRGLHAWRFASHMCRTHAANLRGDGTMGQWSGHVGAVWRSLHAWSFTCAV